MKYLQLLLPAFLCYLLPLTVFGQVESYKCGHSLDPQLSHKFQSFFGGKNLTKSKIVGSDSCHNNDIKVTQAELGGKKNIPIVFHFPQDQNGQRNFPDDANTRTIIQDIIDKANDKLSNNQPMDSYNGPVRPPVEDIRLQFEFKDAVFYTSAAWPAFEPGTPLDDPEALNVYCKEKSQRYTFPLEQPGVAAVIDGSCGNSNGGIILDNLTPGRQYQVFFRWNGSSNVISWGTATGDSHGKLRLSNLTAGSYTDISVRDEFNQDHPGVSATIGNTSAPRLTKLYVGNVSSCGAANGSIWLKVGNTSFTSARLLYERDGVAQDVQVPIVNNTIIMTNLPVGYYAHVRIQLPDGCISKSLNISIKDNNAPAIYAKKIFPFIPSPRTGVQESKVNIHFGGLISGERYRAWVRNKSEGDFVRFSVIEENGIFKIRHTSSLAEFFGEDTYYEVYVTDINDCNRSNTLTFRAGTDLKPGPIGGIARAGELSFEIFEMHHRYLYKVGAANSPNTGEPYSGPETYGEYVVVMANILIHEFGHIGSLNHVYRTNRGTGPPCSDVYETVYSCAQNNFMDANCGPDKVSFAPCQIEKLHNYLEEINWPGYQLCDNSNIVSSISFSPDPSTGNMVFINNFSGPSTGVDEIFTITPQDNSGEVFYAKTPVLFLNLQRFAGQTIEVCANTLDHNRCEGIESCVTVPFPQFQDCYIDQVSRINVLVDNNGFPSQLDPSSRSTRPHYWTFSSQNESSISSTCVHNPDIIYSPEAVYLGDVLELCVSVLGKSGGLPCSTKICTTIVLPPKYPPCSPGTTQAPFFHEQKWGADWYSVKAYAQSYPYSVGYEHVWVVKDNLSGKKSVLYGPNVTFAEHTEYERQGTLTDLRICHFIRNTVLDCIVGTECQDVRYDCFQTSNPRFERLNYDPVDEELDLQFYIPGGVQRNMEVEIFVDRELVTSYTADRGGYSFDVSIPAPAPCGTFTIELKLHYQRINSDFPYCSLTKQTLTYGPEPCNQSPPGLHPMSPGKRDGIGATGYSLKLAPNPAAENFSILWLEADEAERIEFELYNVLGEKVRHFATEVQAGSNKTRLDLQGLPAGVYLLHVEGRQKQSIKLVIDK
jgi:hypothetical protein